MKNSLKLALIQTEIVFKDPDRNLNHIRTKVQESAARGARIALLPEGCVDGYFIQDKADLTIMTPDDARLHNLATEGIAIFLPFAEHNPEMDHDVSAKPFSSVALIQSKNGATSVEVVSRKANLVDWSGRYVESKIFAHPTNPETGHKAQWITEVDIDGVKIVAPICNDAFVPVAFAATLQKFQPDMVLIPAASTVSKDTAGDQLADDGTISFEEVWDLELHSAAAYFQTVVAICNRPGSEQGQSFWGGSRVIGPLKDETNGHYYGDIMSDQPGTQIVDVPIDEVKTKLNNGRLDRQTVVSTHAPTTRVVSVHRGETELTVMHHPSPRGPATPTASPVVSARRTGCGMV
ncbi:MAG: carbon-nitrogen hydrolase family protein [Corynebacteriales bacterium]|nr:carbon-nitrogen hydrolase family protein [Mycobacteriales bacterium]